MPLKHGKLPFSGGFTGIIIGLLFILTVKDPARKGQQLNQNGQVDQVKFTQCLQFIKNIRKHLLVII